MLSTKCVTQAHSSEELADILKECVTVTYNGINYAEEHRISNRRGMKGFYRTLKNVKMPSCYKVACITRACSVLKSRKKSVKRRIEATHRKPLRPMVCIITGFFITMKGRLFIPLGRDRYYDVQLNGYAFSKLADKNLRSLTITNDLLSLCYSEEIRRRPVERVYGVDRNEKNVTFGDREAVTQVGMSKVVEIRQTTREIVSSFKRNDARVRREMARKYWGRANHRADNLLHAAANYIVETAARAGAALAVEDLTGIRKMYQKGSRQGRDYRFRLNAWPEWKEKRMIEYKAAWNGVAVIQLTKNETYGSSSRCSTCGERLRSPARGDAEHQRMLWCPRCKKWTDRDVNAALNQSARGLSRFAIPFLL